MLLHGHVLCPPHKKPLIGIIPVKMQQDAVRDYAVRGTVSMPCPVYTDLHSKGNCWFFFLFPSLFTLQNTWDFGYLSLLVCNLSLVLKPVLRQTGWCSYFRKSWVFPQKNISVFTCLFLFLKYSHLKRFYYLKKSTILFKELKCSKMFFCWQLCTNVWFNFYL